MEHLQVQVGPPGAAWQDGTGVVSRPSPRAGRGPTTRMPSPRSGTGAPQRPAVLTRPAVAHPGARPSRGLTEALPHRGAERVPQEEFHRGWTTRQWPRHPVSHRGLGRRGCAPSLTDTRSHPARRNAERPAPGPAPRRVPIGYGRPSPPPIGPRLPPPSSTDPTASDWAEERAGSRESSSGAAAPPLARLRAGVRAF